MHFVMGGEWVWEEFEDIFAGASSSKQCIWLQVILDVRASCTAGPLRVLAKRSGQHCVLCTDILTN